jgi:hypothetical protein
VDSFKILPSELSQTVGGGHFFVCHNIWGVAKIQDLPNKLSQTVGVALTALNRGKKLFYSPRRSLGYKER